MPPILRASMAASTSAGETDSGEFQGAQTRGSIFVGSLTVVGGCVCRYTTATLANAQHCLWIGVTAWPK
jgi:hypothetical protein